MKTLFALLFACFGLSAAAHELNDTIVKVKRPDSVLVTRNDSAITLHINGAQNDRTAKYIYTFPTQGTTMVDAAANRWRFPVNPLKVSKGRRKLHQFEATALTFNLGFNFPSQAPTALSSASWGRNIDIEFNFIRFIYTYRRRHSLSLGWSYGWTKMGLEGGKAFHLNNGVTSIGDFEEGQTPVRSVFRLNRHSFPLLYTYRRWGGTLSLGPVFNVNVRPRIYNTFISTNGQEYQDTYKKGIHYSPVNVSWLGQIQVDRIGFFVRYTPKSLFEKGFGPDFQTVTMGIVLF